MSKTTGLTPAMLPWVDGDFILTYQLLGANYGAEEQWLRRSRVQSFKRVDTRWMSSCLNTGTRYDWEWFKKRGFVDARDEALVLYGAGGRVYLSPVVLLPVIAGRVAAP